MNNVIQGLNKEILIDLYWNKKKSLSEIALIFKCSIQTILNRLKQFNIERRNYSDSLKGRKIHWKNKIGESHKGRKLSKEHREKISKTRKEKNIKIWNTGLTKAENPNIITYGYQNSKHWNWKGGISKRAIKIRQSSEYKLWRKRCFERDFYTCQKCGIKGCKTLNVHHIIPFYDLLRKELELFNINNGITLCKKCHKLEHINRTWEK